MTDLWRLFCCFGRSCISMVCRHFLSLCQQFERFSVCLCAFLCVPKYQIVCTVKFLHCNTKIDRNNSYCNFQFLHVPLYQFSVPSCSTLPTFSSFMFRCINFQFLHVPLYQFSVPSCSAVSTLLIKNCCCFRLHRVGFSPSPWL